MVQFQNGIFQEKTLQPPGSIPEWNLKILLVEVGWFKSLIGVQNPNRSTQPGHFPFRKTGYEKERREPVVPIRGNRVKKDQK